MKEGGTLKHWKRIRKSNLVKQIQKYIARIQCFVTLHWRHNERDGASNHWRLHHLLNR